MTIDTVSLDSLYKSSDSSLGVAARSPAPRSTDAPATSGAATGPSGADVAAAVQQLQSAIARGPNPDFTVDYLSGLSVVTVRSNQTGEVMFQIPDARAVDLARLIKEGTSLASLGLFKTTV